MLSAEPIAQEVERLAEPLLSRQGYELVLVEYVPRSHVLRLFIDHPHGITLNDCTGVSRLVGDVLDAEGLSDRITSRYTLEVSSPGLDRPLVKPEHFQRFVGREVQLSVSPHQGRHKLRGKLTEANALGVTVVEDGQTHHFPYSTIERAKLVPEWS